MGRARKPAEETRAEIVAAAKERLLEAGPDAIRLNDLASHVGVSRQAILHHFGSRAGLMREVVAQAWGDLFRALDSLARTADTRGADSFVDHLDHVVRAQGNARLGAQLLLSGEGLPEEAFVDALASLPEQMRRPGEDLESIRRRLLLVGAALFGDAVFGTRLRQALAAPDGEAARADFRRWMVRELWRIEGVEAPVTRSG